MAKLVKLESTAEMAFTPPAGYVTSTLGTDEAGNIAELIKKSDGTITSIGGGGGGGSSEGYVAVEVDGVLKAQKLAFDGTEASASGDPVAIDTVGIFNTGVSEPEYKGVTIIKGTSAFYKCASVDTTAKTWTGYEAIVNGDTGVWSFSETLTEDLPYNKLIPQVGKVYDDECTFQASGFDRGMLIPSDGLVFYAPLSTDYVDVINEIDAIQKPGNFTTYLDNACLEGLKEGADPYMGVLWDNSIISEFIKGTEPFTVFLCIAWTPYLYCNWGALLCLNDHSFNDYIRITARDGIFDFSVAGSSYISSSGSTPDYRESPSNWGSFCLTRDSSGNIYGYYNGVSVVSGTGNTGAIGATRVSLLSSNTSDNGALNAFVSDFAIYNRALTAAEILSMHNNLMP